MRVKFRDFVLVNEEELQIKIPTSKEYWISKGKKGKECVIYTHDDLDGIYSAVAMKEYLISHGFTISGYGIIDYTEGWNAFEIDQSYINISLDFGEDNRKLDVYLDHHMDDDFEKKSEISVKYKSDSCYGLICHLLGIPTDKMALSVISMVDAAKYIEYGVDIRDILNFDLRTALTKENPRLFIAATFNQLIKRSDYRTLIEVVHNGTTSILNIFNLFKYFYPLNNISFKRGVDKDFIRTELIRGVPPNIFSEEIRNIPEFVLDSKSRISGMVSKATGVDPKEIINSMDQFIRKFWSEPDRKFKFDGFVVLKNLAYFPSGTSANALRARSLLRKLFGEKGDFIQFILLDYNSSLQICDYNGIDNEKNLPVLKNGEVLDDLNEYTRDLVRNVLRYEFHYFYEKAKGGGHKGIGNLSNIVGRCQKKPYVGVKIIDLMKNRIISDITGMKWDPGLVWNINEPEDRIAEPIDVNKKLMMTNQIRKFNKD